MISLHEVDKVLLVFFCQRVFGFVVIIVLEEHGEHILHGLALSVAHGIGGGIDTLCHELVLQAVAAAVASDDAASLPEAEVVEEGVTGYSYLAHEQLVDVVDGYEFFPLPFPFSFLPFFSSLAGSLYQSARSIMMASTALVMSAGSVLYMMSSAVSGTSSPFLA